MDDAPYSHPNEAPKDDQVKKHADEASKSLLHQSKLTE
jgi:hypothetical protein